MEDDSSDADEDTPNRGRAAPHPSSTPHGPVRYGDGVAEAIAARATRQKMVEDVKLEVNHRAHGGFVGLQSVSL